MTSPCIDRLLKSSPQDSHLIGIVLMLPYTHELAGGIGTLMEGTGLKNILETVYGENAVVYRMTTKSFHRALRGHLLFDKCLYIHLRAEMVKGDPEIETLSDQAAELYSSLLSGEMTLIYIRNAACSEVLIELAIVMEKEMAW